MSVAPFSGAGSPTKSLRKIQDICNTGKQFYFVQIFYTFIKRFTYFIMIFSYFSIK